jgi:formate--tetrahydrofolate ligase
VIEAECRAMGVDVHRCTHFADGAAGATGLAEAVAALADSGEACFAPPYPDDLPLADKITHVAREIYRAREVDFSPEAAAKLEQFEAAGFGAAPVCMAKTQYSFSADPNLLGAPEDFVLPVRDVRLSAGAGFVVALAGEIMTMPGLPRHPASERIYVGEDGQIMGLD